MGGARTSFLPRGGAKTLMIDRNFLVRDFLVVRATPITRCAFNSTHPKLFPRSRRKLRLVALLCAHPKTEEAHQSKSVKVGSPSTSTRHDSQWCRVPARSSMPRCAETSICLHRALSVLVARSSPVISRIIRPALG